MVASNIGQVAVAVQATKGTPAATAAHRFMLTGGGLNPTPEVIDLEESTAQRLRLGAVLARSRAGGAPAAYMRPDMLGILLYAAMGGKAVAGSADPWTHTFTLAAVQPYLTFWRNVGGILFEQFVDCKISQLVLRSVEGAICTVEATVLGLGAFSEAADLAVPPVDVGIPFVHYDAEGQLKVEAAAVSSIRSAVTTITTGAVVVPGDSVGGYAVAEGMIGISVETMQMIENAALWNRLHYGSATPGAHAPHTRGVLELGGAPAGLDLKWTKRDNAGVAAVPARDLQLLTPRVTVKSISGMETNSNGEPLSATVRYDVYQPAAAVSGLTAILKNAVAAITPA